MSILVEEVVTSRNVSGGVTSLVYNVTGTDTESAAFTALYDDDACPESYDGKYRESTPTIDCVWADTITGDGKWAITVRYNPAGASPIPLPLAEIGSVRIRGTTKGGTMHIDQAIDTVAAYGVSANGTAATVDDYGDMIGVTTDGVTGADIGTGAFDFTVVKVFAPDALPNLGTLFNLSSPWHTNTASFTVTDTVTGLTITLAAGEAVFKGADFGEARADGGVEFSFDFSGLPNATGLKVGPVTGIAKKGWEGLWVRYKQDKVGTLGEMAPKPTAAYVVQQYPAGNFGGLGL